MAGWNRTPGSGPDLRLGQRDVRVEHTLVGVRDVAIGRTPAHHAIHDLVVRGAGAQRAEAIAPIGGAGGIDQQQEAHRCGRHGRTSRAGAGAA